MRSIMSLWRNEKKVLECENPSISADLRRKQVLRIPRKLDHDPGVMVAQSCVCKYCQTDRQAQTACM